MRITRKHAMFGVFIAGVIGGVSAAPPQGQASGQSAGGAPDFSAARQKIAQILKDTGASGVAVAVAKGGKIVWEEGFGATKHAGGAPVTPETMFALASLTKALTATGLMALVERGRVDLDKPANDHLGEGKLSGCIAGAPAASVKNLIYHTSGLPMHWHLFYADRPQLPPDMDESIRRYGILVRPPGEAYEYSNFGYGVLTRIIERASGMSYPEFMAKEIFAPLGMTRSAILKGPALPENTAAKYDAAKKEIPFSVYDHMGASAAYAGVRDVLRFGIFRAGGSASGMKPVLKASTLESMRTQSGSDFMDGVRKVKYLLGSFGELEYRGIKFHVATGGMPGAVSRLDIVPAEGLVSAVLANSDSVDLWTVQQEIFASFLPALREKPPALSKPEGAGVSAKFEPPDALAGVWKGEIRAAQKTFPAALTFLHGGDVSLDVDGRKCTPLSIKTELGDMNFTDGVFSGLFWGRIETPDTSGIVHALYVKAVLRGDRLAGTVSAVSIDSRRSLCLPHWIELRR